MKSLLFLLIYAIFFGVDITHDLADGIPMGHVWHEILMFGFTVLGIIAQSFKIRSQRKSLSEVTSALESEKLSNLEWKRKSQAPASQIRQMIDDQFSVWHLSQSEKDVALLLIKGFSMKEIAEIRSTHEKTVRQQSMNIYRKSALAGRQQLAAFFLEDILADQESTPQTLA